MSSVTARLLDITPAGRVPGDRPLNRSSSDVGAAATADVEAMFAMLPTRMVPPMAPMNSPVPKANSIILVKAAWPK